MIFFLILLFIFSSASGIIFIVFYMIDKEQIKQMSAYLLSKRVIIYSNANSTGEQIILRLDDYGVMWGTNSYCEHFVLFPNGDAFNHDRHYVNYTWKPRNLLFQSTNFIDKQTIINAKYRKY